MNKNIVEYLQDVDFSHLPSVKTTEIKNSGREKPDRCFPTLEGVKTY